MRLLMMGFGNVGRELARILLAAEKKFPVISSLKAPVIGIFTGQHGALSNPRKLDLDAALRRRERSFPFDPSCEDYCSLSSLEAVRTLEYDVLIELSPLSISQHGEPAVSHCREALLRGKHVVTANKGPAAFAFRELRRLAEPRGCAFLFEAAVMDGAPLFNLARFGLQGCRIERVDGILNSTTNFILGRMEGGLSLKESVRIAQKRGFAEADPALDLEGWDAAAKVAVLANALMDADLKPLEVEREGIMGLTVDQLRAEADRGNRMKLMCRAWREGKFVRGTVRPETVSISDPFAGVGGCGCALRLHTDLMGPILLIQESPGLSDTAYGVLNDLILIQTSVIKKSNRCRGVW